MVPDLVSIIDGTGSGIGCYFVLSKRVLSEPSDDRTDDAS